MNENVVKYKASSTTSVKSLSGAIAHSLKENPSVRVEISSVGASSCNQTCKSIASASGYLASAGFTLYTRIGFDTTFIDGEERTVLKFVLTVA